jgi:hypothetical protein
MSPSCSANPTTGVTVLLPSSAWLYINIKKVETPEITLSLSCAQHFSQLNNSKRKALLIVLKESVHVSGRIEIS